MEVEIVAAFQEVMKKFDQMGDVIMSTIERDMSKLIMGLKSKAGKAAEEGKSEKPEVEEKNPEKHKEKIEEKEADSKKSVEAPVEEILKESQEEKLGRTLDEKQTEILKEGVPSVPTAKQVKEFSKAVIATNLSEGCKEVSGCHFHTVDKGSVNSREKAESGEISNEEPVTNCDSEKGEKSEKGRKSENGKKSQRTRNPKRVRNPRRTRNPKGVRNLRRVKYPKWSRKSERTSNDPGETVSGSLPIEKASNKTDGTTAGDLSRGNTFNKTDGTTAGDLSSGDTSNKTDGTTAGDLSRGNTSNMSGGTTAGNLPSGKTSNDAGVNFITTASTSPSENIKVEGGGTDTANWSKQGGPTEEVTTSDVGTIQSKAKETLNKADDFLKKWLNKSMQGLMNLAKAFQRRIFGDNLNYTYYVNKLKFGDGNYKKVAKEAAVSLSGVVVSLGLGVSFMLCMLVYCCTHCICRLCKSPRGLIMIPSYKASGMICNKYTVTLVFLMAMAMNISGMACMFGSGQYLSKAMPETISGLEIILKELESFTNVTRTQLSVLMQKIRDDIIEEIRESVRYSGEKIGDAIKRAKENSTEIKDIVETLDEGLNATRGVQSNLEEYVNSTGSTGKVEEQFADTVTKMASGIEKYKYDIDVSFRPGQQVWLHNPRRIRGRSPKLQKIWDGPYVVDAKINDVIYRIRRNANVKIVHVNRLAPYQGVCEQ